MCIQNDKRANIPSANSRDRYLDEEQLMSTHAMIQEA